MAMDDVFLYCRYQFPLSLTLRTNAIANSIFSWLIVLTINSTFFNGSINNFKFYQS